MVMKKIRLFPPIFHQDDEHIKEPSKDFDFEVWKEELDKEIHSFWKLIGYK